MASQPNRESMLATQNKLRRFLAECVVPLAIQTHALVIVGYSCCDLSAAFSEIMAGLERQYGDDMPFTTMCIECTSETFGTCSIEGTVGNQLMEGCSGWKRDVDAMTKQPCAMIDQSVQTILGGCSHYIVINDGGARFDFQNAFIERLKRDIPTIAVNLFEFDSFGTVADYVSRGMPLLLIDSRVRLEDSLWKKPLTQFETSADVIEHCRAQFSSVNSQLADTNQWDLHRVPRYAYMHAAYKQCLRQLLLSKEQSTFRPSQFDAIASQRKDNRKGDDRFDELLEELRGLEYRNVQQVEIKEYHVTAGRLERFLAKVEAAGSVSEVNSAICEVATRYLLFTAEAWGDDRVQSKLLRLDQMFHMVNKYKDGVHWMTILQMCCKELTQAKQALISSCQEWLEELRRGPPLNAEGDYLEFKQLIGSPHTFSGHLDDIKALRDTMNEIANLNRLPKENSVEANQLLMIVWNHVDIFVHVSRRSKMVTKLSYFLLLLTSFAVTAITVLHLNSGYPSKNELKYSVAGIALFGSFLVTVITQVNPSQKWQQLRSAALMLESEVWRFRTRTGLYNQEKKGWDSGEENLRMIFEATKQSVMQTASLSNTAFAGQLRIFGRSDDTSVYVHGQFEETHCNVNHYSPLPPEQYISSRVEPMLDFYNSRLTPYEISNSVCWLVLLLASAATTVLALVDQAAWGAAVTAMSAALTGWIEFSGYETKITRYSHTICKINSIVLWWQTLTEVDKASPLNINMLIEDCETAFMAERQAWISTSMAQKMIQKASGAKTTDQVTTSDKTG